MAPAFEEQYRDVLQNIEFGVVRVCQVSPELLDYHVDDALRALIARYRAELRGRTTQVQLSDHRLRVYESVSEICEWRLGRRVLDQTGQATEDEVKTTEEIVACLQRIQKSVQRWTKRGGRQGYLTFVRQYVK
jgi:hypothetical protein